LCEIPRDACTELGGLLQRSVLAVETAVKPERVYICLFNETRSAVHFHLFPRMAWMKEVSPDSDDPRKIIDGGIVFSAARRAKALQSEILAQESEMLAAIATIRSLMAEPTPL
jgi:diadenosine tetraphosphate (Ap4A) HIT family hydrolase